jgi:hypothetical protein
VSAALDRMLSDVHTLERLENLEEFQKSIVTLMGNFPDDMADFDEQALYRHLSDAHQYADIQIHQHKLALGIAMKFPNVGCSNCGGEFGRGDSGFSHCENHKHLVRIF